MKLLATSGPPVRLTLSRDRTTSIKKGHPWVFLDCLQDPPPAAAGSLALLRQRDGTVVAQGIYDPGSHLAFRVCAVNPERFDDGLAGARLERAYILRQSLMDPSTTGYRLVNGEGDALPGLVCDVYGDFAVVQLDGAGPGGFWHLPGIAQLISKLGGPKNIYRKHRSGEPEALSAVIHGRAPVEDVVFTENGLRFAVNLVRGQKTGFFLDQRDNRARIERLSRDRRVLNLFSYTGGFSIYAGRGGAASVTSVDSAKPAIDAAVENWRLNGFDDARHDGVANDAFEFLEEARRTNRSWDLVIVDPPSFAPGKHHVDKAREAYKKVLTMALHVTEQAGLFAASSCSSHISPDMFLEICAEAVSAAKRRATVLGIYGQPEDHPFPLACQELRYLKFVLLRVE